METARIKKRPDFLGFRVGVFDTFVVDAVAFEQVFIGLRERSVFHAAILPDDNNPTARFQNAAKFLRGKLDVEPVEGLACGDEIDSLRRQGGGFSGAANAREICATLKDVFASGAHFGVGLDTKDWIAVFEEQ